MTIRAGGLVDVADLAFATADAWDPYTPVLGGTGVAINNGTITGSYVQIGKTVHFTAKVVMGTTTSYGSGAWTITVPVTPLNKGRVPLNVLMADLSAGTLYQGLCYILNTATGTLVRISATTGAQTAINATSPFTWASTDELVVSGTYEAA